MSGQTLTLHAAVYIKQRFIYQRYSSSKHRKVRQLLSQTF